MKRGTTPTLKLSIDQEVSDGDRVDFIFKSKEDENADALLELTYPSSSVSYEGGEFFVELNEQQTRFLPEGIIYVDVRVVAQDGSKVYGGKIKKIRVEKTLFKEEA